MTWRLLIAVAWAIALLALAGPAAGTQADATDATGQGRDLYIAHCATCHGLDATGGIGPTLVGVGAASADFQLSTGRMPLADPSIQSVRKDSPFTETEIAALVDYVALLGEGPPIPAVDATAGDVARGGSIFRTNCAGCHGAAGRGEALSYGRNAPDLYEATPVQIAEAMLTGPSQMPVFSQFGQQEVDDVASYVAMLQEDANPGGLGLGRLGPVPEGLVAWLVGISVLIVAVRTIERRGR